MPFDQASYSKPRRARKKVKKKAKKKAKKKVAKKRPAKKAAPKARKAKRLATAKRASVPTDERLSGATGKPCLRSPCGIRDPEIDWHVFDAVVEECEAGLRGQKERAPWPRVGQYMILAYGGGVDSTAMLVGLNQLWKDTRDERWIPRAVVFADVGGESQKTYNMCKRVDRWLKETAFKGAPKAIRPDGLKVVCYGTTGAKWGSCYTLEQKMLVNHTMPGISFSTTNHTCTINWKIKPQRDWFKLVSGADPSLPLPVRGKKILKAIGYDATENYRKEKGSTYTAKDEEKFGYKAWFPLLDWGWSRARCMAEIYLEFGAVPRKSSCFFCGAMKPKEVIMLAEDDPGLFERAVFMELVAIHGRHRPRSPLQGLSQGMRWSEAALGDLESPGLSGSPLWRAHLIGGVVRVGPSGKNTAIKSLLRSKGVKDRRGRYVAYIPPGEKKAIPLNLKRDQRREKNMEREAAGLKPFKPIPYYEMYVPPLKIPGLPAGTLISRSRFNYLARLAKKWIAESPKKKGGRDMSASLLARKVPAFSEVIGFRAQRRGDPPFVLNVLREKMGTDLVKGRDDLSLRASELIAQARASKAVRRNPLTVSAPEWVDGVQRSPFEAGL
jgi:hypothetical protein